MENLILRGAPVRERLTEQLKKSCDALGERGITPRLGIFRMGEKADDLSYERSLLQYMKSIGVAVTISALAENESEASAEEAFSALCSQNDIDGVLPLMPLPPHCCGLLRCLPSEKDVDGLRGRESRFSPCTPEAALAFADYYELLPPDAAVTVIGRSELVGAPLAQLLRERGFDVRVVHSRTPDPFSAVRHGDVVFSAVGNPRFLDERYLRSGQTVIDIAVCADGNGGLCGDLDPTAAEHLGLRFSSVPGGVGLVTVSILARHILASCEERRCRDGKISLEA